MPKEPKKDLFQRFHDELNSEKPETHELKAEPKWHELKVTPPRWRDLNSPEWHEVEKPETKYNRKPDSKYNSGK